MKTIYQLAGVVGIDPGELTLRELVIMADSKQKASWEIASAQMCLLANINRTRKTKFKPADFNPFSQPKNEVIYDNKMALEALKTMANGKIRKVKR